MLKTKQSYFSYVIQRTKSSKPFMVLILIYAVFCFASFIYFMTVKQIRDGLMSLLFILFIPLVYFLEKHMKLKFVTAFLTVVLFIAAGSIMGSCYNLYTIVPVFDAILHTLSGFIFACLGFGLMQIMIGRPHDKKTFLACLLFGFVFSLAIGLLWELFEYFGTAVLGMDMQEDTLVSGFHSYFLSGTHTEAVDVDGIVQTVIYFDGGKTLTLDGYLDLGLIDTIEDMAVCFWGSVVYIVLIAVDWCKKKVLFKVLIPQLIEKEEIVPNIIDIPATELCDVAVEGE